MPIEVLSKYTDVSQLNNGDRITVLNGHEICRKYIPRRNPPKAHPQSTKANKKESQYTESYPLFIEHEDTAQLAYNQNAFKPGDICIITLKMHGTSARTANTIKKTIKKRSRLAKKLFHIKDRVAVSYDTISGTRRTTLRSYDGGFYGNNSFRKQYHDFFKEKLPKGIEVYYEIVGYTEGSNTSMAKCNNKLIRDKEFAKKYGKETVFSYGCSPTGTKRMVGEDADGRFMIDMTTPKSDVYVYRMTMTNEDGNIVEYTPNFMRYRCELMGVKCVPVMWKGIIPNENYLNSEYNASAGEYIKMIAEQFYDGPDPIGKTHVREGVVIRILNRPKFCAYKHKNWYFKALEGIVKVDAEAPDMEEADGLEDMDSN